LDGRDFDKKKRITAGVYLREGRGRLIGLAEIFDYKKRAGRITIGYRVNEKYWHQGIASEIIALLVKYLSGEIGIPAAKAFVMPENDHSSRALLRNGFIKDDGLARV
jgi:[ribosomal protein S5]-alanine N-acetyltransferase